MLSTNQKPAFIFVKLGLYGPTVLLPGTHLLEPIAKENCENSKLAYGSSNEVNAEMLSEKVVVRKFFRLVTSYDDVTVTSPKTRKSLIFLQIMIKIYILCQIYIYAQVLHIVQHAFCII